MALLGLLEVDRLDPQLIGDYGSYGRMFERFFDGLRADLDYRYYQVQDGELPGQPTECDAYLITGSRASAFDDLPWINPLLDWIRGFHLARAKIIGICFGHQIIARALGGRVERSLRGWGLGARDLQLIQNPAPRWLSGTDRRSFRLLYSHQDQVVMAPHGAVILAGDPFCPIGALTIGDHLISFQGHPEFTPDYLKRLMQLRRNRYPDALFRCALESIDRDTDAERIGRWLLNLVAD